ncbi:twin-arginine translocase subunit TatC [Clostridium lacusfryxellense]|uniref:twin-arginine translocase subunit TatC n=1 Tax=Clostridium lacusfryxellense TaxID=205328 RepID=UPI001C0DAD23|nr:twin-arginine translocase subunit TatC [Clostridium lacusfryxellense]MBU3112793.1 twin-arginine translocase subunit TatC [Clostridium lacusfryxellense]
MIKSELIVQAAHWLEKFRKTILWIILIIIAATSLVYLESNLLISVLAKPLNGIQLHFMTPSEGLMAKIRVSVLGGLVIASPVIILLIIQATGPILTKKIKKLLIFVIIPLSFVLFAFGMYFGYTLVLPTTIKFLMDTSDGFMKPILSANEYFSFIGSLLFCIGIIFELPLILIALSRIGIINFKMLKKARKMTILFSFIAAALITPSSDAFTLMIVTLPILALYEISIWSIFLLEKKDKRKKNKEVPKQR